MGKLSYVANSRRCWQKDLDPLDLAFPSKVTVYPIPPTIEATLRYSPMRSTILTKYSSLRQEAMLGWSKPWMP